MTVIFYLPKGTTKVYQNVIRETVTYAPGMTVHFIAENLEEVGSTGIPYMVIDTPDAKPAEAPDKSWDAFSKTNTFKEATKRP